MRLVAAGALLALAAVARAFTPDVDYAIHCRGCHLADGGETPGLIPALRGSVGRFLRVPGGREFLVQVPGVAQSSLDDAALAAVLNWMLDRFGRPEMPEPFVPYTAAEVGALRRTPLVNVDRVRAALLGAGPP